MNLALLGAPNVGKSALFGALTGAYATVSNYPGTTVELATASLRVGRASADLIDTPGVLSLLPATDDERVTRDVLLDGGLDAIVVVGDAKDVPRTIALALQVAELQCPFAVCLNMADEARAAGLPVDAAALERLLRVPVRATSATRGEGVAELRDALAQARCSPAYVSYPGRVEQALRELEPLLPRLEVAPRALALMALADDGGADELLEGRVGEPARSEIRAVRARLAASLGGPVAYELALARSRAAQAFCHAAGMAAAAWPPATGLAARLDRLATHPRWGYALLALTLLATYELVGVFGAGTLVDLLERRLFGQVLAPWATELVRALVPWTLARDLLVGPYGLFTMALGYSLGLVLPIVATFFLAFAALEDSGYLPRLAVMADRAFRGIGLNGKAVLPMVLGLGCGTMATLTTRVLETRKERLIVILLLALGVPCSSQLAVALAVLASLPAGATLVWAGVVAVALVAVGRLAARALPGARGEFVIELPPLRVPAPGNVLRKTLARVEWYLAEAVPLFVLGTLLLFAADRLGLLGSLQRLAEPLVVSALGLPREAAQAFVLGFLRRDFGAAGLYRLGEAGALDPSQKLVAVVTTTLFMPCIASLLVIVREQGWRTALVVAGVVFGLAFAVGAALAALLS